MNHNYHYFLILSNALLGDMLGDYALIVRRAKALFEVKGFKTVCLSTGSVPKVDFPYLLFAKIDRFSDFLPYCERLHPTYIVLYGYKTALALKQLKRSQRKYRYKLVADIQGCPEEGTDYDRSFKAKLAFFIRRFLLKKLLGSCEFAFITSKALAKYCDQLCPRATINKWLVRCGTNEKFDLSLFSAREKLRAVYNIPSSSIVYVYAGGTHPWQRFDDIVDYFSKISNKWRDAFFVFLTPDSKKTTDTIMRSIPANRYLIKFAGEQEYKKILSLCDAGIILRDYNTTNQVAFPNKFSDYLLGGLTIITTHALEEQTTLLEENHIDFVDAENVNLEKGHSTIVNHIRAKNEYLLQCQSLCDEILLYSKQIEKIDC